MHKDEIQQKVNEVNNMYYETIQRGVARPKLTKCPRTTNKLNEATETMLAT